MIGGRYGLSSKEFTPAMVKAVYDNLARTNPKEHFTVGIQDDVTHTSLDYDPEFSTEPDNVVRALFYGLGRGWHSRRQQELHQDYRRKHRQLCAGLLCLRFEEIRRHDRLASALRPEADPLYLSGFESELRRLPSVDLPRALRHAERAGAWRHLPAEQSVTARTKSGTIFRGSSRSNSSRKKPSCS